MEWKNAEGKKKDKVTRTKKINNVVMFRYLGTTLIDNFFSREIKNRLNSGNAYEHTFMTFVFSFAAQNYND